MWCHLVQLPSAQAQVEQVTLEGDVGPAQVAFSVTQQRRREEDSARVLVFGSASAPGLYSEQEKPLSRGCVS